VAAAAEAEAGLAGPEGEAEWAVPLEWEAEWAVRPEREAEWAVRPEREAEAWAPQRDQAAVRAEWEPQGDPGPVQAEWVARAPRDDPGPAPVELEGQVGPALEQAE
jgi:hypothetical protein